MAPNRPDPHRAPDPPARHRRRGRCCLLVALTAAVAPVAIAQPLFGEEPQEPQEEPEYPSEGWTAREAANYARTREAPEQQASDPEFQQRWQEQSAANFLAFTQRQVEDPDWRTTGNLCETWGEQCTGDPFRYPGVDPFYDAAVVEEVAFLDRGGARLAGHVWAPATGDDLATSC